MDATASDYHPIKFLADIVQELDVGLYVCVNDGIAEAVVLVSSKAVKNVIFA